jgi:hypothetical protein
MVISIAQSFVCVDLMKLSIRRNSWIKNIIIIDVSNKWEEVRESPNIFHHRARIKGKRGGFPLSRDGVINNCLKLELYIWRA